MSAGPAECAGLPAFHVPMKLECPCSTSCLPSGSAVSCQMRGRRRLRTSISGSSLDEHSRCTAHPVHAESSGWRSSTCRASQPPSVCAEGHSLLVWAVQGAQGAAGPPPCRAPPRRGCPRPRRRPPTQRPTSAAPARAAWPAATPPPAAHSSPSPSRPRSTGWRPCRSTK